MKLEIQECLKLYGQADDLAKSWFIKSWNLKVEDKVIALAYFSKTRKERKKLANQLYELTRQPAEKGSENK